MDVPPSPKFHDLDVRTPVDVSVNWTGRGALPCVRSEVKAAIGGSSARVKDVEAVSPSVTVTVVFSGVAYNAFRTVTLCAPIGM